MKRRIFSFLLRLAVSTLLVGYFIRLLANQHGGISAAWKAFHDVFARSEPQWLLAALALMLVGYSLLTLRWRVLLGAQDHHAPYGRLFRYYIMSTFFNTFLPSTIGGDALRVVESRHDTARGSMSLMVVLIERLSGLSALVLIAAAGILLDGPLRTPGNRRITVIILVMALLGILTAALCHPRAASRWLPRLLRRLPGRPAARIEAAVEAVWVYYRRPASLAKCMGISVVFQFNMVIYYYVIARSLGSTPDFADFLLHVPIMIFLLMTVPAINGLGIRTAGFRTLMRYPAAFALAAEVIDLGFRITLGMVGGVVFLAYRREIRRGG